jgi:hypothetical protein
MSNPSLPPISDPKLPAADLRDPEAPRLTDLDNPPLAPGTDIVPPAPPDMPERREGVVSDPDAARPSGSSA